MTTISVVIRAYNEAAHLPRLLHGLSSQTVKVDEVILVDSGSTDSTVAVGQRMGVDKIVEIAKDEFTFGRSLNLGCAAADGDLIVIPSAHVYPLFDSWIERLVRPLIDDPEVVVAYGRQVGDSTTRYSERQIMEQWFPSVSAARQSHPFSNNANAAIRRSWWVENPYDETLTGLEDLAFAKKAMEEGHAVAYVAEAPVAHVHREDWQGIANRYQREAIAHKRIFDDQALPAWEAALLWVRNVMNDYGQAKADDELLARLVEIPWFRSAQFLGTFRGFRQSGPVSSELKRRFFYPDPEKGESVADNFGNPIDYATFRDLH